MGISGCKMRLKKAGRSQTVYDHVNLVRELGLYLNILTMAQVVK